MPKFAKFEQISEFTERGIPFSRAKKLFLVLRRYVGSLTSSDNLRGDFSLGEQKNKVYSRTLFVKI